MAANCFEPLDRRLAIRISNQTLSELHFAQHHDKTSMAPSAIKNFQERKARLYEQNAPPDQIQKGVEHYVRRWLTWASSGLQDESPSSSRSITTSTWRAELEV